MQHGFGDWHPLADALRRAGTPALLDPPERWQIFPYLPAAAYLFAPLAALPLSAGFVANAFLMMLCAGLAGLVAARVFALPRAATIALFVTWPPVVYSAAIVGQNAAFGLLLSMLAIAGMATRSPLLTALPIAVLLYKPTYAVPLIAVLVICKSWRACGIVGVSAVAWYVLSAVASGNDWRWPSAWWRLIASYAPGDLVFNGPLAISATATLMRFGVPSAIVVLILVVVVACGYLAIVRSKPVEAMSGATLLALAWSPHAWAYDAALALPMIAFAVGKLRLSARTGALFVLYVLAASFFFSRALGFDPLLVITVGGSSAWMLGAWNRYAVPGAIAGRGVKDRIQARIGRSTSTFSVEARPIDAMNAALPATAGGRMRSASSSIERCTR
jgi:hypothetical protein